MNVFDIAQGIILSAIAERSRKHDLETINGLTKSTSQYIGDLSRRAATIKASISRGKTALELEILRGKIQEAEEELAKAQEKYSKTHDKHGYRIDDMEYIFKEEIPPVDQ